MNKKKLYLGLTLFAIGLLGVFSLMGMEIPLPEEEAAKLSERFTPLQLKLVILINPTVLLTFFVVLGTILYDKAGLRVPIIEGALGMEKEPIPLMEIVKFGGIGGVASGILILGVGAIFMPYLPDEFMAFAESFKPSLATRFLYGGFTEEILMRFGLMSLLVWLIYQFTKKHTPGIYWAGILIAAFAFAMGHFPIVFMAGGPPTAALISYIMLGNVIGGIIFGWLYWKKGLESAFLAHFCTHVVMVVGESLLGNS